MARAGLDTLSGLLDDLKALLWRTCSGVHCFPAGTWVATPHGHTAIETLHVGDLVLAEDPVTKKVAPEPVQAVIVRPRSELVALDLSDGSTLQVQPDHVFWVDHDPALKTAGWLTARRMHRGDTLRTASGRDVTLVRLRWHVGWAVVYTLTVAHLHTFFVGRARVLVHNSDTPCDVSVQNPGLFDSNAPRVDAFPEYFRPTSRQLQTGKVYAQLAKEYLADVYSTSCHCLGTTATKYNAQS